MVKNEPSIFGNLLKKADLFGQTPQLLYRGEHSCKSRYGGIITLIVIIAYLLSLVFTIWRYFEKSSPETNVNSVFLHDPVGFEITKDSFPFAFGIQDSTGTHFIDPQIYTVKAFYKNYKKSTINDTVIVNRTVVPLNLVRCTDVGLSKEDFHNVDLANMLCLEEFLKPNTTMNITGVYESSVWGFLDLKFYRCNASETICKAEADIDAKLSRGFFAINYMDMGVKPSNFTNPVEPFPTSYFTPTSTSFQKTATMRFENQEILTQSSLVGYMEPEVVKLSRVKYFVNDITLISPLTAVSNFFSIQLRMDQVKTQVNRKYQMVYQYLAEFGGLIQVIAIVSLVLTYNLAKTSLTVDLLGSSLGDSHPLDLLQRDSEGNVTLQKINNESVKSALVKPDHKNFDVCRFSQNPISGIAQTPMKKVKMNKVQTHLPLAKGPLEVNGTDRIADDEDHRVSSHRMQLFQERQFDHRNSNESNFETPNHFAHRPLPISRIHKKRPSFNTESFQSLQRESESEKRDQISESHTNALPDIQGKTDKANFVQVADLKNSKQGIVISSGSSPNKSQLSNQYKLIEYLDLRSRLRRAIGNLKFIDYLGSVLWPCLTKNSNLETVSSFSNKEIQKNFDMTKLLKTVNDLEKYLKLALTKEQRLLFEALPSSEYLDVESINEASTRPNSLSDSSYQAKLEKLGRLKESLQVIQCSDTKSTIDQNILHNLGFLLNVDLPSSTQ